MDRSRSRIYQSAGSLLVGAGALAFIGNALHPRFDATTSTDAVAFMGAVEASNLWMVSHLLILAAVVGIIVGLVALATDLADEDRSGAWAWASAVLVLLAGTYTTTFIVIDGIAMDFFATSEAAADPAAATAIAAIERAGFAGLALLMFGIVPMALGMALVRAATYPHWTGFVFLGAGVAGIVAGAIVLAAGEITVAANVVFVIASMATTINSIWLGVLLRRHASTLPAGVATTPA
jgi:hypothetical protein